MPTENDHIIRRKIATGAVYAVVGETGGDLASSVTEAAGRALTEHYKIKSSANCASEMPGTLGELIEKNGENRRGFLYRVDGETECLVLMDPAAVLITATWAHEGLILEEPVAPTAKISTIDQRIASILAQEIVQAVIAGDDEGDECENDIELVEVGVDASRFIIRDETIKTLAVELEGSTMDGAALGTITLLLPDALFASDDEAEEIAKKQKAAADWTRNLTALVRETSVEATAIIARQNIDFKALSRLKPGEVITLRGASLDAVLLQQDNDPATKSLALGAVRSFDGQRTMQISVVDPE